MSATGPTSPPAPVRSVTGSPHPVALAPPDPPPLDGRPIHGWVLDPDGRPVAGARVTPWRRTQLGRSLEPCYSVHTGPDGRFEVRADLRGAASLVVEHGDFLPWEGVLGEESPAWIRLRAPAQLTVRVLDARGQPALGSVIEFAPPEARAGRRRVTVDATGRAQLEGLRPGPLQVRVRGPGGSLGPVELSVGETREVVLELETTRVLTVQVQGSAGEPLSQARVVVMPVGERRVLASARTNAQGLAHFKAAPAGPLALNAEHPGGLFESRIAAEGKHQIRLRSEPVGTLTIATGDTDPGRKPRSLLVELSRAAGHGEAPLTLLTQGDRELHCAPLAIGHWIVTWSNLPAGARGTATRAPAVQPIEGALAHVEIREGEDTRLAIEPPPVAELSGALAGAADGIRVVELTTRDGETVLARSGVDPAGTFGFESLLPGWYSLRLRAEGGGVWNEPRPLFVEPGVPLEVTLTPVASRCLVVARTVDGEPIATARARLHDALTGLRTTRAPGAEATVLSRRIVVESSHPPAAGANEVGQIELELLPAGPHMVVVAAPGFEPTEVVVEPGIARIDATLRRQ